MKEKLSHTIKKWDIIKLGHNKTWTHYIYINIDDQIAEKDIAEKFWLEPIKNERSKRVTYNYWDSIIDLLKFHGGCTWYSKESGPDEEKRIVKIGCDYQHLWDEGKDYDVDYVKIQCELTIDSLLKVCTIKKWCSWCGNYDLEENFTDKNRCSQCKDEK